MNSIPRKLKNLALPTNRRPSSNTFGKYYNRYRQMASPETKIFFIGFNKCATSALHHLMNRNCIRSAHYNGGKLVLAQMIETLASDREALKAYFAQWTAYSDMTFLTYKTAVEGNRHFRLLHELFPKSFFVLNDRDTESWIRSRERHSCGTGLARWMSAYGADVETTRQIWRNDIAAHRAAVASYFKGNHRFLHFFVDRDSINVLASFLWPTFHIDARHWTFENVTFKEALIN